MRFPARSILLNSTRHIGDVPLTTPLLRSLRLAYPDARIDALLYIWTASILDGNPDANNVITVNQDPRFLECAALVKKIFRRYDLAVAPRRLAPDALLGIRNGFTFRPNGDSKN